MITIKAAKFVKLEELFGDKYIVYSAISVIVSIVLSLMVLFFMSGTLPSEVPLFYSLPGGAEQLASSLWLLVLPVGSFVLTLINYSIIVVIYRTDSIFARILAVVTGLVSFLAAFSAMRIMLLIV